MAKPFQENGAWAFRACIDGNRIYRGGFASEKAAREAQQQLVAEHKHLDTPTGLGPHRTNVAAALLNYGLQTLPFKKGAPKEVNRINRYLRSLGQPLIALTPTTETPRLKASMRSAPSASPVHFTAKVAGHPPRFAPASLRAHRAALASECEASERLRKRIAGTLVADVSSTLLQAFVDAMVRDGYGASTVHNEVAVLRQLFKHAKKQWKWSHPLANPASGLRLPSIDNARDRVLSEAEWERLVQPLAEYDNPYALPLVCLMLETAMRSCEPLTLMHWRDIAWERRVIVLPDGKAGKREVPLSPSALLILSSMKTHLPTAAADERVFPMTYEALKKAWRAACEKAGVEGVKLHDLRHTSATRYSLQFSGNIPVLKLITGHRTSKMVERYVNLKSEHVAALMHGEVLGKESAPAGHVSDVAARAVELISHPDWLRPQKRRAARNASNPAADVPNEKQKAGGQPAEPSNVIHLKFGRAA